MPIIEPTAIEENALSRSGGFTLIEVLVAISVLLVAITAPMLAASRSVAQGRYASEEITAYYLAQEGLEYMRVARDDNFIADNATVPPATGPDWLANIDDASHDCVDKTCYVDPSQASPSAGIAECSSPNACPALNFNSTVGVPGQSGFYGYSSGSGWQASPYTRSIKITPVRSDDVIVTSTVTWKEGSIPRSFSLSEHLEQWLAR